MKITSVQNIFNTTKYPKNNFAKKPLATNPNNSVSFGSKDFVSQAYDDFMSEYFKQFQHTHIEFIVKMATKIEQPIGRGSEKNVYNFPCIKDYVIGQFHEKEHLPDHPMKKSKNVFSEYNFSQPILDNGNDIIIMKRIKGQSHSIKNWADKLDFAPLEEVGMSKEHKDNFLSSLRIVESFPQSAYTDLASQIKYLSDCNYKFDSINPNNLIVDKDSETFSIIDLTDYMQTISYDENKPRNSVHDMINLLCDGLFQKYYLNVATDSEKEEITKLTKSIIQKSKKAAKETGLSNDDTNLKKLLEYCKLVKIDWPTRRCVPFYYEQFCELYKDDLK